MFGQLGHWLKPPVFEGDEEKTRVAAILYVVLFTLAIVAAALLIVTPAVYGLPANLLDWLAQIVYAAILVSSLGMALLVRRGHIQLVGWFLCSLIWVATTFSAYSFGGLLDPTIGGYFLVVIFAALILGGRGALLFALLALLSGIGLFYGEVSGFLDFGERAVEAFDLFMYALILGLIALLLRYAVRSLTLALDLARGNERALDATNRELVISRDRLARQATELERRARYLEVTATVARDATLELDVHEMLVRLLSLVGSQLGFYHAGIFFLEPGGEWLELQAASSKGGQRMLARGHRLRVGEGIVGYVAQHRRYRLAMDVGEDAVFFNNPDLPETRSEAALPLMARGVVIGVLDVQSTEPEAFSDEDMTALQTLADQVALAISNAQLFQQAQESLEAERRAYGELSRRAWQELLRAQPDLAIVRDKRGVLPVDFQPDKEAEQALQTGRLTMSEDRKGDGKAVGLAVPIRVRGQVIGAIDVHKPAEDGEWTPEQIVLLETLSKQVSDALEGARLYREAQRRAARDRVMAEVTAHMRETLDMDTVLRTAALELEQRLGLYDVTIRLTAEDDGG
jgi:GAF domain-containing protein